MSLKRRFDQSISGGFGKQILWLIGFTLLVLSLLFTLSFLLEPLSPDNDGKETVLHQDSASPANSVEKGNSFNRQVEADGRFWAIVSQFMDAGNMDKADKKYRLFISLVALAGTAILGGLLISTVSNAFERRVDKIKNGQVRYRFSGHTVIIGFDVFAIDLVRKLFEKKQGKIIVLFSAQNPVTIRRTLEAFLDRKDEKRIVIYNGSRGSREQIGLLCLDRASGIYILGDSGEDERDAKNLYSFKLIRKYLSEKRAKKIREKTCYVLLHHHEEYRLAQDYDLNEDERRCIRFLPVNFSEEWSRLILSDLHMCMINYDCSQGNRYQVIPSEQLGVGSFNFFHLIVIGFGDIGKSFTTYASRVLHFPNLSKTRISIIDPHCGDEFELFERRFPGYESIYDIEYNRFCASPFSSSAHDFIDTSVKQENAIVYIVICMEDSDRSLAAGLNMPLSVYEKGVPVVVRYNRHEGLSELVHTADENICHDDKYSNVRFWGMSDFSLFDEQQYALREKFASAAHTTYLRIAKEMGFYANESPNCQPYENLPSTYQWSNRYLADSYQIKLRSAGYSVIEKGGVYDNAKYSVVKDFDDSEIENLAQAEHARWVADRVMSGWTFGEKRDNDLKKQPNINTWDAIDPSTKQYDYALIRHMIADLSDNGFVVLKRIEG